MQFIKDAAKHRIACTAAFLVAFLAGTLATAEADDASWHWIWLRPAANGWSTLEGESTFAQSDGKFVATLRPNASGYPEAVRIEGRMMKTHVEATVTEEGTDASPERYVGDIQSTRSRPSDPGHGWGNERISLRNASSFIGLYRTVRAGTKEILKLRSID